MQQEIESHANNGGRVQWTGCDVQIAFYCPQPGATKNFRAQFFRTNFCITGVASGKSTLGVGRNIYLSAFPDVSSWIHDKHADTWNEEALIKFWSSLKIFQRKVIEWTLRFLKLKWRACYTRFITDYARLVNNDVSPPELSRPFDRNLNWLEGIIRRIVHWHFDAFDWFCFVSVVEIHMISDVAIELPDLAFLVYFYVVIGKYRVAKLFNPLQFEFHERASLREWETFIFNFTNQF